MLCAFALIALALVGLGALAGRRPHPEKMATVIMDWMLAKVGRMALRRRTRIPPAGFVKDPCLAAAGKARCGELVEQVEFHEYGKRDGG